VGRFPSQCSLSNGMEARRYSEARRRNYSERLAGPRWWKLGPFPRSHLQRRKEAFLWPPSRYGRWRQCSIGCCSLEAIMRYRFISYLAAALALAALPLAVTGQNGGPPKASPKVPRAADGHPDLNGVWQGGSNRIGTWEEANGGGGTNSTTGQT